MLTILKPFQSFQASIELARKDQDNLQSLNQSQNFHKTNSEEKRNINQCYTGSSPICRPIGVSSDPKARSGTLLRNALLNECYKIKKHSSFNSFCAQVSRQFAAIETEPKTPYNQNQKKL